MAKWFRDVKVIAVFFFLIPLTSMDYSTEIEELLIWFGLVDWRDLSR